jgi:hypothetical protein
MLGSTLAVRVWRYDPLTKGMFLALPAAEAKMELETDSQTLQK